jgi:hypothetical protein
MHRERDGNSMGKPPASLRVTAAIAGLFLSPTIADGLAPVHHEPSIEAHLARTSSR